jgi:hypothetical protein
MILMEPEQALAVIDRTRFRVRRADYLRHDFTVSASRWDQRPGAPGAAEAGSPSSAA